MTSREIRRYIVMFSIAKESKGRPGRALSKDRRRMGRSKTRHAVALAASLVLLTLCAAVFSVSNATDTYDPLGRVPRAVYSYGVKTITYSYDAAGNRTGVFSILPS
jgi:hypothetical protein